MSISSKRLGSWNKKKALEQFEGGAARCGLTVGKSCKPLLRCSSVHLFDQGRILLFHDFSFDLQRWGDLTVFNGKRL